MLARIFTTSIIGGDWNVGAAGGGRAARGALSSAVLAKKLGKKIIVPAENREEAAVCGGVPVHGVKSLGEVVEFLNGTKDIPETSIDIESYFALASGEGR